MALAEAIRRLAAQAVLCACIYCAATLAGTDPAAADDTAEWFGHTFKGTNLGLSAGVMLLGNRVDQAELDDDDEVRAPRRGGKRASRRTRGVRLASLDHSDMPQVAATRPTTRSPAKRARANRRTRLASLGHEPQPEAAAEVRRPTRAAARKRVRRTRVASLGGAHAYRPLPGPSLSGQGIRWIARSGCLNSSLVAIVQSVASQFGGVTVNSTCRSRRHNARVGGARHSYHLGGNAVDFRVRGNWRAVISYLRGSGVGGVKHYGGGLFHVDTGPRRRW